MYILLKKSLGHNDLLTAFKDS